MTGATDPKAAGSDQAAVLDVSPAMAVKAFLAGLSNRAGVADLGDDTPLLASGLLDSLGILQLAEFLRERFAIEVENDEFTEENFATVGTLLAYVDRKAAR